MRMIDDIWYALEVKPVIFLFSSIAVLQEVSCSTEIEDNDKRTVLMSC